MKTIIISIPCGGEARNILRTDVFKVLKSKKLRIVILTPAAKEESFVKDFVGKNIIFEAPLYAPSLLEHMFVNLTEGLFFTGKTNTMKVKLERLRVREKSFFTYIVKKTLSKLMFHKSMKLREFFRKLDEFFFPDRSYGWLFKKYRPSLVFLSDIFRDVNLLKRAKKEGVLSVAVVPNWDHMTSRGGARIRSDKLIVWNELMKEEAIRFHDFRAEDIFVCGAPQFDIYFHKEKLPSKKEFFKKTGLNTNRKLLVYAPGVDASTFETIETLYRLIKNNKFVRPCQLLVRRHFHERRSYERYRNLKHLVIQDMATTFKTLGWSPTEKDMIELAATMYYADVVIIVVSTIGIDACIAGTPVVSTCIPERRRLPYPLSIVNQREFDHVKNFDKFGAVRIVKSEEELLNAINEYLKNPKLDERNRKEVVRRLCHDSIGKAGKTMARYVLSLLDET